MTENVGALECRVAHMCRYGRAERVSWAGTSRSDPEGRAVAPLSSLDQMDAERGNSSPQHSEADEYWLRLLTGEDAIAGGAKRLFRKIPSAPRCKLCYAPFAGPYVPILKMLGFRRWSLNQQLCRRCMRDLDKHRGTGFAAVHGCAGLNDPRRAVDSGGVHVSSQPVLCCGVRGG